MRRTPLKATAALTRRTPLVSRSSPVSSLSVGKGRKPIRVVSVKMRKKRDRYALVRRSVYVRCGGLCERCGRSIDPVSFECHHRLRRSQGGPDTLANCVAVCQTCHRDVHAHPSEAYATGWLVQRDTDPATVRPTPLGESFDRAQVRA